MALVVSLMPIRVLSWLSVVQALVGCMPQNVACILLVISGGRPNRRLVGISWCASVYQVRACTGLWANGKVAGSMWAVYGGLGGGLSGCCVVVVCGGGGVGRYGALPVLKAVRKLRWLHESS